MAISDWKMIRDEFNIYDWGISETGDFITENSFDSALLYSTFGERRATESEVLVSSNRRGWIGNETNDFENGSKLWLFEQSRLTGTVLNGVRAEAQNAYEWLLEDNLVRDVIVETVILNSESAGINVTIERFDSRVDQRFFELWDNTGQS